MKNQTSKEKRQIEILSIVQNSKDKVTVEDLCFTFKLATAQIQRDLKELRSRGIAIHSTKQGLHIEKQLTLAQYNELLSQYLVISGEVVGYPKNISLTTKKLKSYSLHIFTSIVTAIESHKQIRLNYSKYYSGETVIRIVDPYHLVPTNRNWRLIASSEGYFKQFYVENIQNVDVLSSSFKPQKDFDIKKIYKTSFEIWGSDDEIDVCLLFDVSVAPQIINSVWSEEQEIEILSNGKARLKMKVNSIEQIGEWVITWGSKVVIEKPNELKQYVVELAKGILQSNK